MDCQLTQLDEVERTIGRVSRLSQGRVRILRMGKRRLIYEKNRLVGAITGHHKGWQAGSVEIPTLHEGEIVRVKSREEIKRLLDDAGKFKGVWFIDEQFEHCGKEYEVLRVVESFFDEARQRTCKCKNTVLLKECCCSGRQRLYTYSCDRNCFLFWHTAWLEKK